MKIEADKLEHAEKVIKEYREKGMFLGEYAIQTREGWKWHIIVAECKNNCIIV
jgi:hypothetical protein